MYSITVTSPTGDELYPLNFHEVISIRPHKVQPSAVLLDIPHVLYCEHIAVASTAIGYDREQKLFFVALVSQENRRTKYFKMFGLSKQLRNMLIEEYLASRANAPAVGPGSGVADLRTEAERRRRFRELHGRSENFFAYV